MSQEKAYKDAIEKAKSQLRGIDLAQRCRLLGLSEPKDGVFQFRAFGTNLLLRESDFEVYIQPTDEKVKLSDYILILHYLLNEKPVIPTGNPVSFRELPGGQFYWQAFRARTVKPLLGRFGNDIESLKRNLERFDYEEVSLGDVGATIHGIGKLYVTLAYHYGDEELPAEANIFFDECIKEVFDAEDTSVLASRICLGLL